MAAAAGPAGGAPPERGPDGLRQQWWDFDGARGYRLFPVNRQHSRYQAYKMHTDYPQLAQLANRIAEWQRHVADHNYDQDQREYRRDAGVELNEYDPSPRDPTAVSRGSGVGPPKTLQRSLPRGGGVDDKEWGTSSVELDRWCKRHKVEAWRGVWSWDEAPAPYRPKNFCVILNLANASSPSGGTHWVACRVRGRSAEYFDSYGQHVDSNLEASLMGHEGDPPTDIRGWLSAMGVTSIQSNKIDLQSVGTDVCGQYACWFCLNGLPSNNPLRWGWASPTHRAHNDVMIKRFVKIA